MVARAHQTRGNFEDYQRVKAAALAQSDDAKAVWAFSVELEKAGKLEPALALLGAFCSRIDDPLPLRRLILLLNREKRFPESTAILETSLGIRPDDAMALGLLALVYAATQRTAEALEMGRKAIAAGSDIGGLVELVRRLSDQTTAMQTQAIRSPS